MTSLDDIRENGLLKSSESFINIPSIKTPIIGKHQLVVLGNGFDLECGLPTRFCHFFKPRIEALKSQDWKTTGKLEGLGYEATPTLWDFLLRSKMYAPWYSVEDAMSDLVMSAGNGSSAPTGLASKLIARVHELAETDGEEAATSDADAHKPQLYRLRLASQLHFEGRHLEFRGLVLAVAERLHIGRNSLVGDPRD